LREREPKTVRSEWEIKREGHIDIEGEIAKESEE